MKGKLDSLKNPTVYEYFRKVEGKVAKGLKWRIIIWKIVILSLCVVFLAVWRFLPVSKQEKAHKDLKLFRSCRAGYVSRTSSMYPDSLSLWCRLIPFLPLLIWKKPNQSESCDSLCSAPEESFCFLFNYVSFFITIILETVAHWMVFKAEPFFLECRGLDDLIWFGNKRTVLQLE